MEQGSSYGVKAVHLALGDMLFGTEKRWRAKQRLNNT
jgi:hypothetical protein